MASPARYYLKNEAQLVIQKGDITQWEGDAVVNAANGRMLGGGGVDGAIHRAAGPGLLQACRRYPDLLNERCPTGDARVTLAYELPCKWIIHTVGPIYNSRRSRESQAQLISAYMSSLAVANGIGATTIAFPAISCGIYGYPLQAACTAALQSCFENSGDLKEVHFVLFGEVATADESKEESSVQTLTGVNEGKATVLQPEPIIFETPLQQQQIWCHGLQCVYYMFWIQGRLNGIADRRLAHNSPLNQSAGYESALPNPSGNRFCTFSWAVPAGSYIAVSTCACAKA
ncbi:hypothetical protein WJX82_005171 [Trebouxia sp. C0006]